MPAECGTSSTSGRRRGHEGGCVAEAPPSVRHLKDLESDGVCSRRSAPWPPPPPARPAAATMAAAVTRRGRTRLRMRGGEGGGGRRGGGGARRRLAASHLPHRRHHQQRPGGMAADGQHRQRISAVNAIDNEPFPEIEYLHACVGGEGVEIASDAAFLTGCGTIGGCCQPEECSCMHEQVVQSGKVLYDEKGRLQAADGTPIYECNSACSCAPTCRNVVQRGIAQSIQVYKTRHKGWARARAVPGVVRLRVHGRDHHDGGGGAPRRRVRQVGVLDALRSRRRGGAGRVRVHNRRDVQVRRLAFSTTRARLRQMCVWVNNVSLALPRIFFATRRRALEELVRLQVRGGRPQLGRCGAPNCRKWLY